MAVIDDEAQVGHVESYVKCGGCDRFLMEARTLAIRTDADGMKWATKQYLFRPWAARVLTRTRSDGPGIMDDAGHVVKVTEVAHACCVACIEKVVATWSYDVKNVELRALPRDGLVHVDLSTLDGRDVVLPVFGFRWPAPEQPSDEWIGAEVLRATYSAKMWPPR